MTLTTLNWRAILALLRKDLLSVTRSTTTLIPLVLVPIIILVVVPGALVGSTTTAAGMADLTEDAGAFLANLPQALQDEVARYDLDSLRFLYLLVVYQFVPLFLIVPVMVASVMAADSFAGEQERKTIEALIYTPMTDLELLLSKTLSALVPAVAVTLVGGAAYMLLMNVMLAERMGGPVFPTPVWLLVLVWLAPALAALSLATMIVISARVKTFRDAYQWGGMTVIPLLVLFVGQLAGLLYLNLQTVLVMGLVVWLVSAAVIVFGARTFQRSEIMARL